MSVSFQLGEPADSSLLRTERTDQDRRLRRGWDPGRWDGRSRPDCCRVKDGGCSGGPGQRSCMVARGRGSTASRFLGGAREGGGPRRPVSRRGRGRLLDGVVLAVVASLVLLLVPNDGLVSEATVAARGLLPGLVPSMPLGPLGPMALFHGLRGGGWVAPKRAAGAFGRPAGRFAKATGRGGGRAKSTRPRAIAKDDGPPLPAAGYKLVIVESPAKARTIQKFLDMSKYVVDSCMGHVRDLPGSARSLPPELKARFGKVLGVDPDNNFEPFYTTLAGKEGVVARLIKSQKKAAELILATDEDREGEAISWHLLELLKPKIPVKRAVFHEITREAITRAFESPRQIDMSLVEAQEARRILDRLAGYTMSPLLWKKIAPSLSAGRVQSVGLAIIVRRERLRLQFQPAKYHDLKAIIAAPDGNKVREFPATLFETGGKKIATGKDFNSEGQLENAGSVVLIDQEAAAKLSSALGQASTKWDIASIETKRQKRKPPVPFITSTLQQEANSKLGMSSKETMRTAQSLYERGFITYMRTDNPVLSSSAVGLARKCVTDVYGAPLLQGVGQGREAKKPKGSQEAHEAIRPAVSEDGGAQSFRLPSFTGLSGREAQLYELIFQRTLASVMIDAVLDLTTAIIRGKAASGEDGMFRANGKVIVNPGWMRAYEEGHDGRSRDDHETQLPPLKKDQKVDCKEVLPESHTTKPPPRFTEASFVKELEALGIGRPSTYAQILETLKERNYVSLEGKALMPSLTAFVVTSLLEQHFPDFVDTTFTASMEARLDKIAHGEGSKVQYLTEYYLGDSGLRNKVVQGEALISPDEARKARLPMLDATDSKIQILVGPWGPYVQKINGSHGNITRMQKDDDADGGSDGPGGGPSPDGVMITAKLPPNLCSNLEKLDMDTIEMCLQTKEGPYNGTLIGNDPDTEKPVLLKIGPFGVYLQLGAENEDETKPKRVAVPKEALSSQISLDIALKYLSLPRVVCQHPETSEDIKAGIGRFGPFVQYKGAYKSLTAKDNVLELSAERALELVSTINPNAKAASEIAELGEYGKAKVRVMDGRFGPYIKCGTINARLPPEYKDHPNEVPLAEAIQAIQEKEAMGKGKGKKTKGVAPAAKGAETAKRKSSTKLGKPAKTPKKADAAPKTRRPLNAFNFFCRENRQPLADKGLKFGDITKELSSMWNALDAEARVPYDKKAAEDKILSAQQIVEAPASSTKSKASSKISSPIKKSSKSSLSAKKSSTTKPKTSAKAPAKAVSKPKDAPKRPLSAYMLFSVSQRPAVAAQGLSFGDTAKKLSEMWKDLSDAEKARYEKQAQENKERYLKDVGNK